MRSMYFNFNIYTIIYYFYEIFFNLFALTLNCNRLEMKSKNNKFYQLNFIVDRQWIQALLFRYYLRFKDKFRKSLALIDIYEQLYIIIEETFILLFQHFPIQNFKNRKQNKNKVTISN